VHAASPVADFGRIEAPENLHYRVIRTLALRVIEAERSATRLIFPNEAGLCHQLGVSRSIVREAVKVLADKGMIEVRPRSGTASRPRSQWNLLDPDILAWQAQLSPDARLLRDLCEVRLAIEPTASGFAALRGSPDEIALIGSCFEQREAGGEADTESVILLNLQFQSAVVAASHNTLFSQLSAVIREPFRAALSYTARLSASVVLELEGYREVYEAIRAHDPLGARAASEKIVGLEMLAVERIVARASEAKRP
jgi:GntR family galactonate operon transcriptional repressor